MWHSSYLFKQNRKNSILASVLFIIDLSLVIVILFETKDNMGYAAFQKAT